VQGLTSNVDIQQLPLDTGARLAWVNVIIVLAWRLDVGRIPRTEDISSVLLGRRVVTEREIAVITKRRWKPRST